MLSGRGLSQAERRLIQRSVEYCHYVTVLGFLIRGNRLMSTGQGMECSNRFWPRKPRWSLRWVVETFPWEISMARVMSIIEVNFTLVDPITMEIWGVFPA